MMIVPPVVQLLLASSSLLFRGSNGVHAWVLPSRPAGSCGRSRTTITTTEVSSASSSTRSTIASFVIVPAMLNGSSSSGTATTANTNRHEEQQQAELATAEEPSATTTRRDFSTLLSTMTLTTLVGVITTNPVSPAHAVSKNAGLDINNALAREYTAFPGLYPTVATKLVNAAKKQPFTSKQQVYAALSEAEAERLKQYDKNIVINKVDKSLQQFKTSQICKYECGSRVSSSYRDEQIKQVQKERR